MKLLVLKIALFLVLNVLSFVAWAYWPMGRNLYTSASTNGVVQLMPEARHISVVIAGSSHGRQFSYGPSYDMTRRLLGYDTLNISKAGKGPYVERILLGYFFEQGNTADTVLYVADPWAMYSDAWNEQSDFLDDEAFSPGFLEYLVRERVAPGIIAEYIRTKYTLKWLATKPLPVSESDSVLPAIDRNAIAKRMVSLYPNGVDADAFERYSRDLERCIILALEHKSRVVILLPPTLLGVQPGDAQMRGLLDELKRHYGIDVIDAARLLTAPRYFGNHDHLNSQGIQALIRLRLSALMTEQ